MSGFAQAEHCDTGHRLSSWKRSRALRMRLKNCKSRSHEKRNSCAGYRIALSSACQALAVKEKADAELALMNQKCAAEASGVCQPYATLYNA